MEVIPAAQGVIAATRRVIRLRRGEDKEERIRFFTSITRSEGAITRTEGPITSISFLGGAQRLRLPRGRYRCLRADGFRAPGVRAGRSRGRPAVRQQRERR